MEVVVKPKHVALLSTAKYNKLYTDKE